MFYAERLTKHLGGAKIYFKREELNHTGAHKINHCMGQILLAKRMGKTRIIAETGAGQHGVATATVAALFNLKCIVYMASSISSGKSRMCSASRLLGADVIPVKSGSRSLKDSMNEALARLGRECRRHFLYHFRGGTFAPRGQPLRFDLSTVPGSPVA